MMNWLKKLIFTFFWKKNASFFFLQTQLEKFPEQKWYFGIWETLPYGVRM
jgi:hypothetical protein